MKIKNLNIKRRLLSLALATTMSLSMAGCTRGSNNNDDALAIYDGIEIQSQTGRYRYDEYTDVIITDDEVYFASHADDMEYADNFSLYELEGNATITANLNFRLGPSTDYKKIDLLDKGMEVRVFGITNNNWYMIKANGNFGYVSGEYISFTPEEEKTIDNRTISKYVYTTTGLNFRTGPSTDYSKIDVFPYGTKLAFLDRLDNNWYLVRYDGKVGYVSGKYISTKNPNNEYRDDFIKVVYATRDLKLRSSKSDDSESLYDMSEKEACEVLEEDAIWYKVRCNNQIGYIPRGFTKELTGIFVVVDIGDQTLTLYDGNTILLEVDITSGTKGKYDTPFGLFSIQSKSKDTYLTGPGYRSHVDYWMPFYYGYGIHDADWRQVFGEDYYERNGSHGCVNVPPEKTQEIYDNVEVGTKVLVHK